MPGPDDTPNTLPDLLRDSNRPIIVYQGPPSLLEPQTGNALVLVFWLALFTLCVGVAAAGFWSVWNPGYDARQESLIYSAGRPQGLVRQIDERRQINERAEGLFEYLDGLRTDNMAGRPARPAPAILADRNGIDDLRREWDAMCLSIRERIYDRRIGRLEGRIAELRQLRARARDPGEQARIDGATADLQRESGGELERRRLDLDPALRCVPASQAPACSEASSDLWCNPQLSRPEEFLDEAPDDRR